MRHMVARTDTIMRIPIAMVWHLGNGNGSPPRPGKSALSHDGIFFTHNPCSRILTSAIMHFFSAFRAGVFFVFFPKYEQNQNENSFTSNFVIFLYKLWYILFDYYIIIVLDIILCAEYLVSIPAYFVNNNTAAVISTNI